MGGDTSGCYLGNSNNNCNMSTIILPQLSSGGDRRRLMYIA